jgi:hypothetical protein
MNDVGNAISDNEDYRLEVLLVLPNLEKLDKETFKQEDYEEAKEVMAERIAEAEANVSYAFVVVC